MLQEERLFRAVVDALTQDRLTLPTLPEVAMRVSQATQDDRVTASRLAAEIGRDPAIAVRVLRVANSSALNAGRRIDNLQQAITRMGMGLVRSLVTGVALEQLFFSRSPTLKARLRQTWAQSLEVAALSQVLASHCTVLRPELAMLAGLTHEIGSLPVIRLAENLGEDLPDAAALDRVIRNLQPRVGRLVLQAWDFPEELVEVPSRWIDFSRSHDGPPDFVDVVTVAALQSHQHREGRLAGIDRQRVPAFRKLDINPEVDVFELEGLQQEYQESYAALTA
ncbi:HDOD domain-containing protein [Panacagrimonas sp.]|uniref:HDOD domain-containing protein n=1 Tax=Panacagrimonas sp. TaxID=2480088 RepID=UPI003B516215